MDKETYIKQLIDVISDSGFTIDEVEYITNVIAEYFKKLSKDDRHYKIQTVIDDIGIIKCPDVLPSTEDIVDSIMRGRKEEQIRLLGGLYENNQI